MQNSSVDRIAENHETFPAFIRSSKINEAELPQYLSAAAERASKNPHRDRLPKGRSAFDKAISGVIEENTLARSSIAGTRRGIAEASSLDRIAGVINFKSEKRASVGSIAGRLMEQMYKSQKMGGLEDRLNDYYKSLDHVRDVFDPTTRASDFGCDWADQKAQREVTTFTPAQPNPIHQTNEHLAGLSEKIDALVGLQAKHAEVIDKLLQAQIANEAAQDRTGKRAHRLSILNMILASTLGLLAIIATVMVAG